MLHFKNPRKVNTHCDEIKLQDSTFTTKLLNTTKKFNNVWLKQTETGPIRRLLTQLITQKAQVFENKTESPF